MKHPFLKQYPAPLTAVPRDALWALDAISRVASQDPDLQSLYSVIHREVCKVMESDAFYVCRYTARNTLDFVYQFDEGILPPSLGEPLGDGPTSYCIRTGEAYLYKRDNAEISENSAYMGQERRSRSAVHVPLLVKGTPIGVISSQSYRADAYDESHARLLGIIAGRAAVAIQNAELRERNRRHEERLSRLSHSLRVGEQTLRSVGDLVMTCDLEGVITAYNQAVCDVLACSPRDLVGHNIISLRTSDPGDWLLFRHARNRRISITATDGCAIPIVYSTDILLDDADQPMGYLVVARNLSDLQRAEEAGRAALSLERHRISRDLHDGLVQSLAIAKMQLQILLRDESLEVGTRDNLGQLRETLTRGLSEARQYIVDLKHTYVDTEGLVRAGGRYAKDFGRVVGLVVEVESDADDSPLGNAEEVQLFYILREALSNVRKHADATTLHVRFFRTPTEFVMCVEDDGRGFNVAACAARPDASRHWGLPHMRERAEALGGTAEIFSRPGQGTRVCIRLPIAVHAVR